MTRARISVLKLEIDQAKTQLRGKAIVLKLSYKLLQTVANLH